MGIKSIALRVISAVFFAIAVLAAWIGVSLIAHGQVYFWYHWAALLGPVVLLLSAGTCCLAFSLEKQKRPFCFRTLFRILLAVYLVALLYLLFFSRDIRPYSLAELKALDISECIQKETVNLTPFATLRRYHDVLTRGVIPKTAFGNILGNIVLFMPLGILMTLISRVSAKPYIALPVLLMAPLLAECLQFLLRCGVCDVDDAMLNLVGGLIAYAIMMLPFIHRPIQGFLYPDAC